MPTKIGLMVAIHLLRYRIVPIVGQKLKAESTARVGGSMENRDTLLVAYGYLWLFQGDAEADNNARFAFEARRQLLSLLTKEDRLIERLRSGEGISLSILSPKVETE